MKNVLVLSFALVSSVAFANQATDSIKGPITCKGRTFSVTISSNRKTMVINKDGEAPETLKDLQQMVGDTETNYTPKGQRAPTLSFNDQGDFLQFDSTQNGVSISCPQGK
jgi:hypothetical protein